MPVDLCLQPHGLLRCLRFDSECVSIANDSNPFPHLHQSLGLGSRPVHDRYRYRYCCLDFNERSVWSKGADVRWLCRIPVSPDPCCCCKEPRYDWHLETACRIFRKLCTCHCSLGHGGYLGTITAQYDHVFIGNCHPRWTSCGSPGFRIHRSKQSVGLEMAQLGCGDN